MAPREEQLVPICVSSTLAASGRLSTAGGLKCYVIDGSEGGEESVEESVEVTIDAKYVRSRWWALGRVRGRKWRSRAAPETLETLETAPPEDGRGGISSLFAARGRRIMAGGLKCYVIDGSEGGEVSVEVTIDAGHGRSRWRALGRVRARKRRSRAAAETAETAPPERSGGSGTPPPPRPFHSSGIADSASTCDGEGGQHFEGGSGSDLLSDRYRIVRELGRGTFGRVVECVVVDLTHWKERLGLGPLRGVIRRKKSGVVAVKIVRNAEQHRKNAEEEAGILREVNGTGGRGVSLFPALLDSFCLPSGHLCLVFELLGMSLYEVLKGNDHEPFSMMCIQNVATQLFDAIDHIHSLSLIHTDLKPENVVLASDKGKDELCSFGKYEVPAWTRIKIIDFGSAVYDRGGRGRSGVANTRNYRAPEILLGLNWSFPSDIWAAGCLLAELCLGDLLFPTRGDAEHLALVERTVGPFPRKMLRLSSSLGKKMFDAGGRHRMGAVLSPESERFVNKTDPLDTLMGKAGVQSGLVRLLRPTLFIDPKLRPTAKEALDLSVEMLNDEGPLSKKIERK